MVSEPVVDERPDFRNAAVRRHRRSGSAPPSPAPWATSHSDGIDAAAARTSVDDSALGTLPRQLSFDAASSLENDHALKSTGLSFLHRRKVRKASSTSGGMFTAEPLPLAEKKKSQLFAPLLHRRQSQMHDVDPTQRLSQISFSGSIDQHDDNAVEGRPSQDSTRVLPKRSQTLRTQPYEAPYFFPTPGSVVAETYLPPRRNPVRSKTLAPDELGVLQ
ncbi:hypothetical protein B0H14DRAFT_2791510 [Mycena olivaceomarginata]|nr:hypothetical protein B0H14DRAFT_2791510 [Mycena olivaceomarginata]